VTFDNSYLYQNYRKMIICNKNVEKTHEKCISTDYNKQKDIWICFTWMMQSK